METKLTRKQLEKAGKIAQKEMDKRVEEIRVSNTQLYNALMGLRRQYFVPNKTKNLNK